MFEEAEWSAECKQAWNDEKPALKKDSAKKKRRKRKKGDNISPNSIPINGNSSTYTFQINGEKTKKKKKRKVKNDSNPSSIPIDGDSKPNSFLINGAKKRKPNKRNKYRNNTATENTSISEKKSSLDESYIKFEDKPVAVAVDSETSGVIKGKNFKKKNDKRKNETEDASSYENEISPNKSKLKFKDKPVSVADETNGVVKGKHSKKKKNKKKIETENTFISENKIFSSDKSKLKLEYKPVSVAVDNEISGVVNGKNSEKNKRKNKMEIAITPNKKKKFIDDFKENTSNKKNKIDDGQEPNSTNVKPKEKKRNRKKKPKLNSTELIAGDKLMKKDMKNKKKVNEAIFDEQIEENLSENETAEISINNENPEAINDRSLNLRSKMLAQLAGGRFRYLNEQLYLISGREAFNMFQDDSESYKLYHEGYRKQVVKWPVNPVDVIIAQVQKMSPKNVIADFGCGDAKLAQTFPKRTIHSFDLIALNLFVTACDMAKVPLKANSVDTSIFCLSLMGSNLGDYLREANRVLKNNGILKVAELESRFDNVQKFIDDLEQYGFHLSKKEELNEYFLLFDFKKNANVGANRKVLPEITLNPCLYKRR